MHSSATVPAEGRRRWMAVLAKAAPAELETACCALGTLPAYTWMRPPETGLVMIRGRIGGTGAKFNMGEMTVTRCTLRLDGGSIGYACVRGRDSRHVELAAIVDAMMQHGTRGVEIESLVIARLEHSHHARRQLAARKAAATKVEFFTVARTAAA